MKNLIIIDVDTDREKPIIFGKGPDFQAPTTKEEAKEILTTDMGCVLDSLLNLIHIADQNGYGDKEVLVNQAIKELNQYLSLPSVKPNGE
jgi:hypothetical protein